MNNSNYKGLFFRFTGKGVIKVFFGEHIEFTDGTTANDIKFVKFYAVPEGTKINDSILGKTPEEIKLTEKVVKVEESEVLANVCK